MQQLLLPLVKYFLQNIQFIIHTKDKINVKAKNNAGRFIKLAFDLK